MPDSNQMRADAFVTLKLVHPLRKLFPPKGRRVPILMYHSISDAPEQGHPYYRTITTPQMFAQHMQHLKDHGYTTVTPTGALQWLEAANSPIRRPVAITFDDGYRDFYTEAFPVLEKHGFSATVYLPTAYIGHSPQKFKDIDCLTWNQVRELKSAGVEFGSHTVTHPQLKSMEPEAVRYELQTSKETIEQELGSAVTSFAYPYAFPETDKAFTAKLRSILDETGFWTGVSTIIGTADRSADRLFMKRLPANSCDHESLFQVKLLGHYDWVHAPQYLVKIVNGIRLGRQ